MTASQAYAASTRRSLGARLPRFLAATWGRLPIAVLATLWLGSSLVHAQEKASGLHLQFSHEPDDKLEVVESSRAQVLRPNISREVFVHVRNDEEEGRQVTVQLLADGNVVTSQKVQALGKAETDTESKLTPVPWPRIAISATKLTELKGPLKFRMVDGKNKAIGSDVTVEIDRPSNYLEASLRFYPGEGGKNRLEATIKPRAPFFKGPPCRVELVLRPDRIAGFIPGQKRRGLYADSVSARSKSITLQAEDLSFAGQGTTEGLVYLVADGYQRAFTFKTTFARTGTPSTAARIQGASVALTAPRYADPTKPVPVLLEVDDLARADEDTARIKLELVKPAAGKVDVTGGADAPEGVSELAEFRGERHKRLFYSPGGPRGGIVLRAEVNDWAAKLDLSSVFGPARLRVRLVGGTQDKPEPIVFRDEVNNKLKVEAIHQTIILDDTAPEGVKFVNLPKVAVRGKTLRLEATGGDLESGIREVVFWQGKPLPDGKIPSDATPLPAKLVLVKEKEKVWVAEVLIPSDQTGLLTVSVQFVNNVGMRTNATTRIPVVDPEKVADTAVAKAKPKASIAGRVVEGENIQKKLTVDLYNEAGKLVDTTKTGMDGTYLFEKLDPGSYKVSATKTASRTSGTQAVALKEAEKKTGVEIKLYR